MENIHDNIDVWVAAASAGDLNQKEREEMEKHLATCGRCRQLADEEEDLRSAAHSALAGDRPGPGFEDGLVEGFRQDDWKPVAAPLKRKKAFLAIFLGSAAGLAMVAVLGATLLVGGRNARQSPSNLEKAAADGVRRTETARFTRSECEEICEDSITMALVEEKMRAEPWSPGPEDIPTGHDTEAYDHIRDNPFIPVNSDPLSTFSIDVDTASYANVRRFLRSNQLPPRGAVRIEEMVNYFTYDDPAPQGGEPFSVLTAVSRCPWNLDHRLVRVALKGREIPRENRPPANLVFLIDVSGSMNSPNKLPLLQQSMKMLVDQLGEDDHVAIVTYAGSSRVVLPSWSCGNRDAVMNAIDGLRSGGSTNGASGIEMAYQQAALHMVPGGVNRVILATDGDFNVGVTSRGSLVDLIREKARTGVFLTVLGFGMGNYKDATLESLADKGNGNYGYIDTISEARKLLVEGMTGTLIPIAKDVKIQIEFNPVAVKSFRLIGYENRVLAHRDFDDDRVDAGEIGAGHTVTAFYELVPAGGGEIDSDPLKYQDRQPSQEAFQGELLTVRLRYKQPQGDKSEMIELGVADSAMSFMDASADFRFAAAVAAFGMLLRNSPHKGSASFAGIEELAGEGLESDRSGRRAEFIELVRIARRLSGK